MAEPWFRIEVVLSNGREIHGEITEQTAREMLAGQWRYIFHDEGLSDREKVARMLATQFAHSMERRDGMFILDGMAGPGEKWLFHEAAIVAVGITDVAGERRLGFGEFEPLELQADQGPGETSHLPGSVISDR